MKRKVLVLSLSLVAALAVSCKKDYVCDCHKDFNDGTPHADVEIEFNNASKSDAEEGCEAQENVFRAMSNVEKVNCQLK